MWKHVLHVHHCVNSKQTPLMPRSFPLPMVLVTLFFTYATSACKSGSAAQDATTAKVAPLVKGIAENNVLESRKIGFSGIASSQWTRYDSLKKTASIPELERLTDHPNPVVRCYAFQALAARRAASTYTVLLSHLHDTAVIDTQMDCIRSVEKVNRYFLAVVRSDYPEKNSYKLNLAQRHHVDSLLHADH